VHTHTTKVLLRHERPQRLVTVCFCVPYKSAFTLHYTSQ